jgi:hypothetical protein
MTVLTTGSIATETLSASLLALEDLTNRLTVITLNAVSCPDQMPRLRSLLEDLKDALESCEEDLGTYAAIEA